MYAIYGSREIGTNVAASVCPLRLLGITPGQSSLLHKTYRCQSVTFTPTDQREHQILIGLACDEYFTSTLITDNNHQLSF